MKRPYAAALMTAEVLRTVWDLLRPSVYVGPRICDRCRLETDRIDRAQYEAVLHSYQQGEPRVPCWCGGILRTLLEHAGDTVTPDPSGIDRIRIRTTSAPADAAAGADQTTPPAL
ncbi:hypothetical protein [Streptomyces halstedii]|uniref:hypothetical protein n=1 Tax=Streptomyces halstedii TaxID=1944 RepID=UPI0033523A3D